MTLEQRVHANDFLVMAQFHVHIPAVRAAQSAAVGDDWQALLTSVQTIIDAPFNSFYFKPALIAWLMSVTQTIEVAA